MKKTIPFLILAALMVAAPAEARKKKADVQTADSVRLVVPSSADSVGADNSGLFGFQHYDDSWYLQIPESLLERPFLANTRYESTPQEEAKKVGNLVSSHVLYWHKEGQNLQLRRKEYKVVAPDSANISLAVEASSNDPILARLTIDNDELASAERPVTTPQGQALYSVKIDPLFIASSSIFNNDVSSESLDSDLSYIDTIMSYPQNADVVCVCTFGETAEDDETFVRRQIRSGHSIALGLTTYKTRTSFVMLPEQPMRKRFFDNRVGYFTQEYQQYTDEQQQTEDFKIAVRWRLEPRPEDEERYLQGELVEPQKPIIFYVDPATPQKWQPYIIAGVNDWNKAFEAAGWKNAIRGEVWPNDSTMSLNDARYTVIRYLASDEENAMGPNVNDPRTGEVLESHVVWHHNLIKQLRKWYMMQAGAVDPRALSLTYPDTLLGQLVRFGVSHEIGHALGLRHNFGASSAVPVSQLRDARLLHERGFCPSIMDYARFNYVAQPEDGVDPQDLLPRINDYDLWAIRWGYRYFPASMTDAEVKDSLSAMTARAMDDRRLWWFSETGYPFDPRVNIEDLGDDAMLASEYGIRNLQRIIQTLDQWANKGDDSDKKLAEVCGSLLEQFALYEIHVCEYLAGYYTNEKSRHVQGEEIYAMLEADKQRRAMQWLDRHILTEPEWLTEAPHIQRFAVLPRKEMEAYVDYALGKLICDNVFSALTAFAERPGCYQPHIYARDLTDLLFRELRTGEPVSSWRRYVQREALAKVISVEQSCGGGGEVSLLSMLLGGAECIGNKEDAHPFVLAMLEDIYARLRNAQPRDAVTRAHYKDLQQKIKRHFDEK